MCVVSARGAAEGLQPSAFPSPLIREKHNESRLRMSKKVIFAGDKKVGQSILSRPENWLKGWAVPRIPAGIETYHLTLLTVVWSLVNVLVGQWVGGRSEWLWVVSLMIVLQYVTDLFDGELGRRRATGLIKWGFHMDHFLDFIFLCSLVFVGYMISPPGLELWYFLLLVVLGGYMVNSFLSFAATNQFEIYYWGMGPTEMRVVFILVNTFIIVFGTRHFNILLPVVVLGCLGGLVVNVFRTQRRLWQDDMLAKEGGI